MEGHHPKRRSHAGSLGERRWWWSTLRQLNSALMDLSVSENEECPHELTIVIGTWWATRGFGGVPLNFQTNLYDGELGWHHERGDITRKHQEGCERGENHWPNGSSIADFSAKILMQTSAISKVRHEKATIWYYTPAKFCIININKHLIHPNMVIFCIYQNIYRDSLIQSSQVEKNMFFPNFPSKKMCCQSSTAFSVYI